LVSLAVGHDGAACSTSLVMLLLWKLEHARRGLVANYIAEHLILPLHHIDGGVVVVKALLHGGISHAKVGNIVVQGQGCRSTVLYGVHTVAVVQGGDVHKRRNVDGGFPKARERGKVHCVGWLVAACNPGFVFFCKDACATNDTNTDVNDVIFRDGMLGKVGKRCSPEQAHDNSNPCDGCYSKAMAVQWELDLQLSADVRPHFVTNQVNILQKNEVGFFIQISSYNLKVTGTRSRKS
jgi:hypothetical protein